MDMDSPIDLRAVRAGDVCHEMEMKERAEAYNAITGAGYHDLWMRTC